MISGTVISNRLLILLLVLFLITADYSAADQSTGDFIKQHWNWPLAPQGEVPPGYTELEASLAPEACGQCHSQQFNDWQTSLHSAAMGPGLMGQLVDMPVHDRAQHQSCLRCHAPLAEQADDLVAELKGIDGAAKGLHRQGLVCAACHVRDHQRFGPPRKDGSVPSEMNALPHNGWQVTKAFEDSRFCAGCHQFQADGFALNGKLLENTYQEWLESPYADAGVTCQQCHMPERRHLWRGIHDPEMVRSAVTIDTSGGRVEQGVVTGSLKVTNSGAGHRFPTYVTPQVVLHGFQATAEGQALAGTDSYFVIARRVSQDLSAEIFDTRLAPGESTQLEYQMALKPDAAALVFRVWVEPDTFYQLFFHNRVKSYPASPGSEMLQRALEVTSSSRFNLFRQSLPLHKEE